MPRLSSAGLLLRLSEEAPARLPAELTITDECALTARPADDFRVEPLVREGDLVQQGAPVLRSRREPDVMVTAPVPGRVAEIALGPGHRLSSIKFFHEPGAGRRQFDPTGAEDDSDRLRALLLASGLWRRLRSRPYGRVPPVAEDPSAIFVMAIDTRPLAPDPRTVLHEVQADFERGLRSLFLLTGGPVFLCQDEGEELVGKPRFSDRLRVVTDRHVHPHGLPGYQIHARHPARVGRPVWDIHAEDVAAFGTLLREGLVPETRMVAVTGTALTKPRLVRCQPGADLRALSYTHTVPGPHRILSGSPLDGEEARWLRPRDRQVSVMSPVPGNDKGHWFLSALRLASRPMPLVPNAALEQSMGQALPVMPFLRALAAGDTETAVRLGALSLLEEDLALADYVSNADPGLARLLRSLLDRVQAEEEPA